MAQGEKYFVGPRLLGQIRDVIARVDDTPLSSSTYRIETRLQDLPMLGDDGLARGTFTHSMWTIGGTMQVTIQGVTDTISITNYCTPVVGKTASTQVLNVVYGNVMGTMTAVEIQQPTCTMVIGGIDLTKLPNYDANATQILGHSSETAAGTSCSGLQWFGVVQCGSTAA